MCVNKSRRGICREGKFPTYHKLTRHTTRSTKYSQLQNATYYCSVLPSLLRNQQKFAKCHAKTNHTSARLSNDTSSPARVSDDTSSPAPVSDDTNNPARVSDDIGGPIRLWHVSPIRLWHVSPIRLHHVSLTHPQTPINRSLPKAFQKDLERAEAEGLEKIKIEKSRSSVGTKLWILQELQLWIRRAFEEKSSKSSS